MIIYVVRNFYLLEAYLRLALQQQWQTWLVGRRLALTPVAIMEGMAFAATAFGDKPTPPDYGKVLASAAPVCCWSSSHALHWVAA